eukprot:5720869-Amphidinium_carterae.3
MAAQQIPTSTYDTATVKRARRGTGNNPTTSQSYHLEEKVYVDKQMAPNMKQNQKDNKGTMVPKLDEIQHMDNI